MPVRTSMAALGLSLCLAGCPGPTPDPPAACDLTDAQWATILGGGAGTATAHSVARVWDELALHAVRKDLPQPTVHSRALYHLSAAMYDAWAAFDPTAHGVFTTEKHVALNSDAACNQAVSFAAARFLRKRYTTTAGLPTIGLCFDEGLRRLGYDPTDVSTTGDTPDAIGNRIGQAVLDATLNDGSNEANKYQDTTGWASVNAPLNPALAGLIDPSQPGSGMVDPDHWQQLAFPNGSVSQNGLPQSTLQSFVGAQWREVRPFAMTRSGTYYHDPGPAPAEASDEMRSRYVAELLTKQSQLLPDAAATIDISPGKYGNNSLGANDGAGRAQNPVTGQPYAANVVPLADFGRVMAEFWADGPQSETPPGHWNVIANSVTDSAGFSRRLGGTGGPLIPLEWDVKLYLGVNGALHDAAITAWEIKRATSTSRPITLVRYLAGSDARGLPALPGVVRTQSGFVQVLSWHSGNSVTWQLPSSWVPYQKPTFVTPAFPGFISGHSTFSRAAAEVLADFTGTPNFPGGLGEFVAAQGTFLTIDSVKGPSVEVRLQWATYYDAADEAGQSRIWGGIHIEPDDFTGRRLGHDVGVAAAALARRYFAGSAP